MPTSMGQAYHVTPKRDNLAVKWLWQGARGKHLFVNLVYIKLSMIMPQLEKIATIVNKASFQSPRALQKSPWAFRASARSHPYYVGFCEKRTACDKAFHFPFELACTAIIDIYCESCR